MTTHLPLPNPTAEHHTQLLLAHIRTACQTGPISFAHYMDLALYTPELGYYHSNTEKFGTDGDFTTAPEISPLFGECLAQPIQAVLEELGGGDILEFGAGSGRLAATLLNTLTRNAAPLRHYYILEPSPSLQQRQQQFLATHIPQQLARVHWLTQLPTAFCGVMLANEVLDAMPVHRFTWHQQHVYEHTVSWQNEQLAATQRLATDELAARVTALNHDDWPDGYTSEINLALPAWIANIAQALQRGLILLIDYGFPQREYYHPDRSMGTLRCYWRHHAHDDALLWPGLQDISAHVDFTAVAEAAVAAQLHLASYSTQAHFLLQCGIAERAAAYQSDPVQHYRLTQQIKQLLFPSAMGEACKVMALTRDISHPILGTEHYDLRNRL